MKRASRQNFEMLRDMEKQAARDLPPLAPPGSRILVAVSGGPDSVALVHWLRRLPYFLAIGHVDHQIRKKSAADGLFVQKLAKKWDLPYACTQVNAPARARSHHQSLEEAARDLRYGALLQLARHARCRFIATAHTANDQAETVLMNFLRGAGPAGLAGIPASRALNRSIRVIRPFLNVPKSQIELYLRQNSLPYRTDPTNRHLVFTRNWIRHRLFPQLELKFPGLSKRLMKVADIFREEEDFWRQALQGQKSKQIDLANLFRYHKAVFRRKWRAKNPGLSFRDVENSLMNGSPGKEL